MQEYIGSVALTALTLLPLPPVLALAMLLKAARQRLLEASDSQLRPLALAVLLQTRQALLPILVAILKTMTARQRLLDSTVLFSTTPRTSFLRANSGTE